MSKVKLVKATQTAGIFVAGAFTSAFIQKIKGKGQNTLIDQPSEVEDPIPEETHLATSVEVVPTQEAMVMELSVAGPISSQLSFSEAFKTARSQCGPCGLFEYKGEFYSTFLESEYENLSVEDREAYANMVQEEMTLEAEELVESQKSNEELPTEVEQVEETEVPIEQVSTESPEETTSAPQITATEIAPDMMTPIDSNNDGKMDSLLENIDNDAEAEIIYITKDGQMLAFVDTENDGIIDALYKVNADSKLEFITDLETPFPAPKMSVTQYRDLQGNDGVIDAKLYDNNDDRIADRVDIDLAGDGSFSKAYLDTDRDGMLDTVADVQEDGSLLNLTELNEPFAAPELLDEVDLKELNGPTSSKPQHTGASADTESSSVLADDGDVEGMDDEAEVGEWDD